MSNPSITLVGKVCIYRGQGEGHDFIFYADGAPGGYGNTYSIDTKGIEYLKIFYPGGAAITWGLDQLKDMHKELHRRPQKFSTILEAFVGEYEAHLVGVNMESWGTPREAPPKPYPTAESMKEDLADALKKVKTLESKLKIVATQSSLYFDQLRAENKALQNQVNELKLRNDNQYKTIEERDRQLSAQQLKGGTI